MRRVRGKARWLGLLGLGLVLGLGVVLVALWVLWGQPMAKPVYRLPVAAAIDPKIEHLFILDYAASTVSMLDSRSMPVLAVVPVGYAPLAVAVDVPMGRVLVTSGVAGAPGSVAVLDARSGRILRTVPVGRMPTRVAVDSKSQRVFVLNSDGGSVSVLDTRTGGLVRTTAVPLPWRGRYTYVPICRGQMDVSVCFGLDTAARTLSTGQIQGYTPRRVRQSAQGLAVDLRCGHVLVVDTFTDQVSILDARSGRLLRTVPVGRHPVAVAIDQVTGRAYVANFGTASVSILGACGGAVVGTVPVGTGPALLAIDTRAGVALVANVDSNSISTIQRSTRQVVRTTASGDSPTAMALDGQRGQLLVASISAQPGMFPQDGGEVRVLDTRTSNVLRITRVSGVPSALAVDSRLGGAFVLSTGIAGQSVDRPIDRWSWVPGRLRRHLPFPAPARRVAGAGSLIGIGLGW